MQSQRKCAKVRWIWSLGTSSWEPRGGYKVRLSRFLWKESVAVKMQKVRKQLCKCRNNEFDQENPILTSSSFFFVVFMYHLRWELEIIVVIWGVAPGILECTGFELCLSRHVMKTCYVHSRSSTPSIMGTYTEHDCVTFKNYSTAWPPMKFTTNEFGEWSCKNRPMLSNPWILKSVYWATSIA